MKFTTQQIADAIGADWLEITEFDGVCTVDACRGLTIEKAQARLDLIVSQGNLEPYAENYQVRAYLIRNGVSESQIPTLIESVTAPGAERDEALMRWERVTRIPKSYPLVAVLASMLGLSVDAIWWDILEIS